MATGISTSTKRPPTAATPRSGARPSPRYWVCAVLLVAAAAAVHVVPQTIGWHLQKESVALKNSLRWFDAGKLGPRYARHAQTDRIAPMSEDMIESLGSEEFVQIYIADTTKQPRDPTYLASLFVTYYTGKPDMVPHVPDECYLAGGYDKLGVSTEYVPAAGVGAPDDQLPVRMVRFVAPANRRLAADGTNEVAVLYFFNVNNAFATTRNGVRAILSNPFQRYAYYAKIEVTFTSESMARNAPPDEALAALGPLMEAVLPVLYADHLDIDKFVAGEAADSPAGS